MKTPLFYFAGRAGDLPLALLKHATNELAKQNKANMPAIRAIYNVDTEFIGKMVKLIVTHL